MLKQPYSVQIYRGLSGPYFYNWLRSLSLPSIIAVTQHKVYPSIRIAGSPQQSFETCGMDIRQIRYFVHAIEGASLSSAAKRQFVTVQAVSKAISELETELGSQLLIRGNHGVRPTAIGYAFYQRASKVLEDFDNLVDFTQFFPVSKNKDRMLIALCSPYFNNADNFVSNLSGFIGKKLGIEVEIVIVPGREAIEALRVGDFDTVCTLGEYTAPDLDSFKIGNLPTGICVSKTHPLTRKKFVSLENMEPYPVIWSQTFDDFNRSIHVMYRERGLASPKAMFTPQTEDIEGFFTEQNGISFAVFLPFSQIAQPYLTLLPIDPRQAIKVPLYLVTTKTNKSDAYLAFERFSDSIFRGGSLLL